MSQATDLTSPHAPDSSAAADLPTSSRSGWVRAFVLLLGLALVLRIVAIILVPLIPEEAYYWMYAQHPSLSYFDHPPMVAWIIGAGTRVLGNTEIGVRVVGMLLACASSLLMFAFARMWFTRAAALWAAAAVQVLPFYFATGFIATMDSALVFFWLLGLIGASIALKRDRAWGWYLAGIALGGALLSKYTGVFLAVGVGICLIVHRPWRKHLLRPHVYLAFIIGIAMFWPVILWNWRHDWASFRFQFVDRDGGGGKLNPGYFGMFLLFQVLALTPVLLWMAGWIVVRIARAPRRLLCQPRWLLALAFSLPLLAAMTYKSLRFEIHLNWTLPLWLTLLPVIAQVTLAQLRMHHGNEAKRREIARGFAWTAVVCAGINVGLLAYLLLVQPYTLWISSFGPWRALAEIVEDHEDVLEKHSPDDPLIICDGKYRLASVLAFYRMPLERDGARPSDVTTSQWIIRGVGLGFPYWADANHWAGRDCIYVTDDPDEDLKAKLASRFESVEPVDDPRLQDRVKLRKKYQLAICRSLRAAGQ